MFLFYVYCFFSFFCCFFFFCGSCAKQEFAYNVSQFILYACRSHSNCNCTMQNCTLSILILVLNQKSLYVHIHMHSGDDLQMILKKILIYMYVYDFLLIKIPITFIYGQDYIYMQHTHFRKLTFNEINDSYASTQIVRVMYRHPSLLRKDYLEKI